MSKKLSDYVKKNYPDIVKEFRRSLIPFKELKVGTTVTLINTVDKFTGNITAMDRSKSFPNCVDLTLHSPFNNDKLLVHIYENDWYKHLEMFSEYTEIPNSNGIQYSTKDDNRINGLS